MEFQVDQVDHVELLVSDRHEAAEWYQRVLGLSIVPEFQHWADDPNGPLMIATKDAGTKLALFVGNAFGATGSNTSKGIQLVAFRVTGAGFLQFLQRLEELQLLNENGTPVRSEDAVDHHGAYSIYFRDPWGHDLELTSYDCDVVANGLSGMRT